MNRAAGRITRTSSLKWACPFLLLFAGFPASFGIGRQESARSIRERDGNLLKTSAKKVQDPLSFEGQRLLSQIVEAGESGDWMKVNRLYLAYSGSETSTFNAVMHIAIRCGQFKQGASVYQRLCNLNVTKSSPTFSAALRIFAELGQTSVVREVWREATDMLELDEVMAASRIHAAAMEGDIQTAAEVLDSMNKSGVEINIAHITSAIRACWQAEGQSWRAAQYLFNVSRDLGLEAEAPMFTCLVGAYATAPLEVVLDVYQMMKDNGIQPDKMFSELFLASVLAFSKEETYGLRTVSQLAQHLSNKPEARLQAARSALAEFGNTGVETTALSQKLDTGLKQLLEKPRPG
ncbi:PPR4 [Symbiodinium pilosum]|uniref:PPR4 protein n=1 Tax=Symbiodinium pilosum TaxID=2952 RepID=A0A812KHN4_SYMPI|nr:PPR4 [Symbiodinium pilosum]